MLVYLQIGEVFSSGYRRAWPLRLLWEQKIAGSNPATRTEYMVYGFGKEPCSQFMFAEEPVFSHERRRKGQGTPCIHIPL